jgi:hypothetical protein
MKIVPAMREDYIGREDFLEFLETFFHQRTEIGKKSITKGFHNNRFARCAAQVRVGAALGLFGAPRIGAKHEPVEFNAFRLLKHPQHCATTANLDIVAVRPHAQHPLHAIQIARNHFLISC